MACFQNLPKVVVEDILDYLPLYQRIIVADACENWRAIIFSTFDCWLEEDLEELQVKFQILISAGHEEFNVHSLEYPQERYKNIGESERNLVEKRKTREYLVIEVDDALAGNCKKVSWLFMLHNWAKDISLFIFVRFLNGRPRKA